MLNAQVLTSRRHSIRMPRALWIGLAAMCLVGQPALSVSEPGTEKSEKADTIPNLPEPWIVSAKWRGSRGGAEDIAVVLSIGVADLTKNGKSPTESRVDAKHCGLVAEHARDVFSRFQMFGHRIEDGITTNWSIRAGSGTVQFRDRGGANVSEPVRQIWNLATTSKVADEPEKLARPDGEKPPRPLKIAGKKLLDKSVERDAYRLVIRVRGADAQADSVVKMNHRGEFRWSAVRDSAFGLELGTFSRTLNEIDGEEILDLTSAAIETFGFAEPRDAFEVDLDLAAKRSRAELFIESGLGNEDYMVEITETDLDNNPPFKDAVRKLIDTAKKHARLDRKTPNG
jgi:hypothetical protein